MGKQDESRRLYGGGEKLYQSYIVDNKVDTI